MTDSEWTTEPAIYDLTTVPANGSSRKPQKEKISVIDAYAQWKMGPDLGLPYDVANQERLEQQDGSLVVSQIEEIGKRGPPKQIVPEVIQIDRLVRTDPSDGSGSLEDDGGNSGSDIAYGDVLLPLPLRQTSVAKSMTSPRSGWFEVPDGVSPEEVVVVGIIDDAINVAHKRFRDAQGRSRVDFAWIQDAVASDKGEPFRDSYVPYGREWRRRDIDAAKDFYGDNEEAIWRDLQMITDGVDYRQSTLRLRRSHGTHVADLAAGCDGEELSAINKRIITVQLPVLATQDTSGAALIAVIRDAALFIYQRAEIMSRELKVPVPVILNISYGIAGGARDGKHILVRSLQEIAKRYRENVKKKKQIPKKKRFAPAALTVLPAGNGHLARGHAQSLKGSPDELKLRLRLQPQDQTSSHLEIWFPESTGEIEIEIRPPSVASRKITYCELTPGDGEAALKREALVLKVDEQAICRVTIDEPSEVLPGAVPTLHWRVLISFAPTLSYDGYPVAPQGEWRIHAKTSDGSGPISTWISRDESLADFPKLGRQAYFEDEVHDSSLHDMLGDIAVGETPASSVICRNMTISGISSKTRGKSPRTSPIVVGANFWDNHHAVPYTAAGGVLGGLFAEGPVVSASADTSRALPGILAAGNRSGVTVSQNGTSVAVPQTVRWLAEYLRCKSAKERSKLDARKLLQKKFGSDEHQPPRPTADRPELLTQPEIREQRLKGGFLPVHKDHEYGISRKVYAKQ